MRLSSAAHYPLAVFVLIGSAGAASAQTTSCERYRAELASLSRAGATARAVEAARFLIACAMRYHDDPDFVERQLTWLARKSDQNGQHT